MDNVSMLRMPNEKGVTIIELLVVILILLSLLGLASLSYTSMRDRYSAEKQMKEMYIDLTSARLRAMQRNRIHFVLFTATQYSIYEDTDPRPDGNAQLDTANDTLFMTKSLVSKYSVIFPAVWSSTPSALMFTPRGMVDTSVTSTGTVRVAVEMNGEYDCITISEIKDTLGKWDGTQCNAR